jgi:ppGpp synthetase/RelA/SpoT-type nucleotidyltranferase
MPDQLANRYAERFPLLEPLRANLERETREALSGVRHIDRVTFRVKGTDSFVAKAEDPSNSPGYSDPLVEIEDQVAGRVLVFFLADLAVVRNRLERTFNTVEHRERRPSRDAEFGYESDHLICLIPPHLKPHAWDARTDLPTTFELQTRTLFMHAYAEPQHDLAYKTSKELPRQVRRELAWIAASAWGADQAYERVRSWQEVGAQPGAPTAAPQAARR